MFLRQSFVSEVFALDADAPVMISTWRRLRPASSCFDAASITRATQAFQSLLLKLRVMRLRNKSITVSPASCFSILARFPKLGLPVALACLLIANPFAHLRREKSDPPRVADPGSEADAVTTGAF